MRVIIAGSRDYHNYAEMCKLLEPYEDMIKTVISGGARGADALGERWAQERGYKLERYPADWDTHGKSAGYIRNKEMSEKADALIAFSLNGSKGTANMVEIALKNNQMVVVFNVVSTILEEDVPY